MKKIMFAAVLSVVALAVAMPTFAEEAAPKKEAKVAAVKGHDFSGAITAIDAVKGSVTVKNHKDVEKTFAVTEAAKVVTADKAVATLADLKVGEKVIVAYTEDAGKVTVTKIAQAKEKVKTEKAPKPAAVVK